MDCRQTRKFSMICRDPKQNLKYIRDILASTLPFFSQFAELCFAPPRLIIALDPSQILRNNEEVDRPKCVALLFPPKNYQKLR